MDSIEAVADAIMQFEGWFHRGSQPSLSYRNRNPGNLESGGTYRHFPTFVEGYEALLQELRYKFSGQNNHGIGPASTLLELMECYAPAGDGNAPSVYAKFVADWLTFVLGRPILVTTVLRDVLGE